MPKQNAVNVLSIYIVLLIPGTRNVSLLSFTGIGSDATGNGLPRENSIALRLLVGTNTLRR